MLLENVSFKGKTGIITGGAQGIGKAIASQLVAMGGRAVIVDINPVTGEETCRELGNAAFYAVDLADAGQVVRVFEQIIADEKHVDVLINNAGIVNTDDFQDLPLEQWNKILAVDLTAVFLACQVCFRHMAEIGGGRIVNVASIAGKVGGGYPGHGRVCRGQGRRDLPDKERGQGRLREEHLLQQPVPRLHQDPAGGHPSYRREGGQGAGCHESPPRRRAGGGSQRRAVSGV